MYQLTGNTFTVFSHVALLCTQCFYTSTIPVTGPLLAVAVSIQFLSMTVVDNSQNPCTVWLWSIKNMKC